MALTTITSPSIIEFSSALLIDNGISILRLTLLDLLKTIHLFCVFAGVGGAITQMSVLRKHREAGADEIAASEKVALAIARTVEFYGLVLAFITGLILALLTGAFGAGGYLHAKTALVVALMGLSHFDVRNIKKMIALRSEGKTGEADQVKQTHLTLGTFSMILTAAIVFLVINKPF